jgi:hypothetical protein
VRPVAVVERDPGADASAGLTAIGILLEIHLFLRLLILKHIRNWSYAVLEREVRANLVHRNFARIGGGKMPDAKTIGRWGVAVGPEVLKQIHERVVKIAVDQGVVTGRRMRVDTTVVKIPGPSPPGGFGRAAKWPKIPPFAAAVRAVAPAVDYRLRRMMACVVSPVDYHSRPLLVERTGPKQGPEPSLVAPLHACPLPSRMQEEPPCFGNKTHALSFPFRLFPFLGFMVRPGRLSLRRSISVLTSYLPAAWHIRFTPCPERSRRSRKVK